MCDGNRLPRKERIDCVTRVLRFDQRFTLAVVDAALVAQLALMIEDEHVRRRLRSVRTRNRLSIAIVEIREIKVPVRGPDFHFVETVADIRVSELVQADSLRVIGLYRNQCHPFVAIVVR